MRDIISKVRIAFFMLVLLGWANQLLSQVQPGLHVSENFTVLFGKDSITAGNKVQWHPSKAAFRAGRSSSEQWNYDALGPFSAAFGADTEARGNYSFAVGHLTNAHSYLETAIGRYSIAGANSLTDYIGIDPVFEIGNGFSPNNQSNSFTVLKNGNVHIGTIEETNDIHEKLQVDGGIRIGKNIDQSPSAGTMRWDSTTMEFQGWDGNVWQSFGRNRQKTIYVSSQEASYSTVDSEFKNDIGGVEGVYIDDNGILKIKNLITIPISLPNRSIIDTIQIIAYDNSSTSNLSFELRWRLFLPQGFTIYESPITTIGSSTQYQSLMLTDVVTLENATSYIVVKPVNDSGIMTSWGTAGNLKFTTCKIVYREP